MTWLEESKKYREKLERKYTHLNESNFSVTPQNIKNNDILEILNKSEDILTIGLKENNNDYKLPINCQIIEETDSEITIGVI